MRLTSALSLSLLTLAACGSPPPSPSTVRTRIASDLGNVLHETKAASDGSTTSLPTDTAGRLLSIALGDSTSSARVLGPLSHLLPVHRPGLAENDPATASFDPDAIVQWLDDNIFTDANSLGDGVYQIPAELFCTTTSVDSSGNETSSVDPDCVQRVATAQLRVRVEENDSTLRFALQVDANHDEPLVFALSHTSLAITVDLDDAGHAATALAQAFGEEAPNVAISGQITGELDILGAAHAKTTLSFDRALSVKVADQGADLDGPDALRLASEQGQVVAIEIDGNAPLLAVDLSLRETTLHLPGDSGSAATDVDLGGATAQVSYTGGTMVTIDNLSLGNKTTTIAKDGVQAIAIDVNPNDGRTFSAILNADAASGVDAIAVSPRLDLQVAVDHAVLGDAPPVYDVTRLQVEGTLASVPGSDSIYVGGSLALTTSPAQYGFSAATGQCVTATDTYDATSDQFYTAYSVGACQ